MDPGLEAGDPATGGLELPVASHGHGKRSTVGMGGRRGKGGRNSPPPASQREASKRYETRYPSAPLSRRLCRPPKNTPLSPRRPSPLPPDGAQRQWPGVAPKSATLHNLSLPSPSPLSSPMSCDNNPARGCCS
nr:unnamed protein product [Digitaria exilis]CAB3478494.1 unnamed protein product [Digitaria exilis]